MRARNQANALEDERQARLAGRIRRKMGGKRLDERAD
jgi:hypothetical protein